SLYRPNSRAALITPTIQIGTFDLTIARAYGTHTHQRTAGRAWTRVRRRSAAATAAEFRNARLGGRGRQIRSAGASPSSGGGSSSITSRRPPTARARAERRAWPGR